MESSRCGGGLRKLADCINLPVSKNVAVSSQTFYDAPAKKQKQKTGTIIKQPLLALMLHTAINLLNVYFTTFVTHCGCPPKILRVATVIIWKTFFMARLAHGRYNLSCYMLPRAWCSIDARAAGRCLCNLPVNCRYGLRERNTKLKHATDLRFSTPTTK